MRSVAAVVQLFVSQTNQITGMNMGNVKKYLRGSQYEHMLHKIYM